MKRRAMYVLGGADVPDPRIVIHELVHALQLIDAKLTQTLRRVLVVVWLRSRHARAQKPLHFLPLPLGNRRKTN